MRNPINFISNSIYIRITKILQIVFTLNFSLIFGQPFIVGNWKKFVKLLRLKRKITNLILNSNFEEKYESFLCFAIEKLYNPLLSFFSFNF